MAKKSAQQIENEALKNRVKQLEQENKELRSIADNIAEVQNKLNKLEGIYKTSEDAMKVFKAKYFALNDAIKSMAKANDSTLFSRD